MMARACVLLANGFEEIEAITVIDVLRRAGVEVDVLSLRGRRVTGSHGITVQADRTLRAGAAQAWDAVILPGGMPGAANLRDDGRVRGLLRAQNESGRWVAAICAAPMALGAAGVLQGRKATCYPGFESHLTGAKPQAKSVVVDRNVITSRGPGTALEFALALAGKLAGDTVAKDLRKRMLARRATISRPPAQKNR